MSTALALPLVIVAALLITTPAAIARRQWALTVGIFCTGTGVAVQSPPVYAVVDPALGARNLTNLLYHLLTVTGIIAFAVMLLSTNDSRPHRRLVRVGIAASVLTCVYQSALFAVGSAQAGWGGR